MSTSDSDYSIDWLASDDDEEEEEEEEEEDDINTRRWSPAEGEEDQDQFVSPSSSSLRESPSSCSYCRSSRRRRRSGGCTDSPSAAALSPAQGFTSVSEQLPAGAEPRCVEAGLQADRKRGHGSGVDGLCENAQTHTDNELFTHKCSELRCFLQPLSSILCGLRAGRYSQRLSSFQESVAMDRIQRIMGVLQNPQLGGRFLSILLKIEEMLYSWFPHIKPNQTQMDDCPAAKKLKQQQHQRPCGASSPPPLSPMSSPRLLSSEAPLASSPSSTRLKWLHTSPICSLKTLQSSLSSAARSASPPPSRRCRSEELTQDNAVSSTSDFHPAPGLHLPATPRLRRGPPPFNIHSPCLERLLQAKESIISARPVADAAWTPS